MSIIEIGTEVVINGISKLYINPEELIMYASGLWTGVSMAAVSLFGAITGSTARKREAYRARVRRDELTQELKILERNRQTIINPYSGIRDVSSMAKDLSGMVSNPWANLGVATQAADIQIEETDIALANTLDTLRATGASAGGATALAQAALQSKKGVSASIEKQEAQNEKAKAQGEAQLERLQMAEAQRIQGIQLSEAGRLQQADVAGKQFMFEQKENREMQRLNRKQALITGQQQAAVAANQGSAALLGAGFSALGQIGGAFAGAYQSNPDSAQNQAANIGISGSNDDPYSNLYDGGGAQYGYDYLTQP